MLRFLILAAAFYFFGRLLMRALVPGRRPRRGPAQRPTPPPEKKPDDSLRDLTQQEITDADFEEIPPEE
jgi:hypothetical protein